MDLQEHRVFQDRHSIQFSRQTDDRKTKHDYNQTEPLKRDQLPLKPIRADTVANVSSLDQASCRLCAGDTETPPNQQHTGTDPHGLAECHIDDDLRNGTAAQRDDDDQKVDELHRSIQRDEINAVPGDCEMATGASLGQRPECTPGIQSCRRPGEETGFINEKYGGICRSCGLTVQILPVGVY